MLSFSLKQIPIYLVVYYVPMIVRRIIAGEVEIETDFINQPSPTSGPEMLNR